jgi:hypothetical protein
VKQTAPAIPTCPKMNDDGSGTDDGLNATLSNSNANCVLDATTVLKLSVEVMFT